MPSLEALIRQLRVAATRARALRYAVHAMLATLAWLAAVLLASRLTPIPTARLVTMYGLPVPMLLAAVLWALRRPSPLTLARVADSRLNLQERLATAWERRTLTTPMDALQRQDALQRAAAAAMPAAFPLRVPRRELAAVAVVAAAVLALAMLPNPMDQVIARRQADRESQARAAQSLVKTQDRIRQADPEKRTAADPQIQKILDDAVAKILKADSPAQALKAISPAEDALAQIPDPSTPQRVASALNLAAVLSRSTAGQNVAKALAASPQKGADALKELASQLAALPEKDRADLAKALAEAAKRASDPRMRDAMQRAAESLSKGNAAAASDSLSDLSAQLKALGEELKLTGQVASAISALESARAQLAEQADRDAGRADRSDRPSQVQPLPNATPGGQGSPGPGGSPGASPGTGSSPGQGSGSGSGSNPGSGNQGTNPGSGQGQSGSGTGQGGSGGPGQGSGTGSGAGPSAQARDNVFVPGQPIPGQSEEEPTPLGPGQQVPLRSYTDVLAAYQQAALDIIARSFIPSSAKDIVREYFSSLGEGGGS